MSDLTLRDVRAEIDRFDDERWRGFCRNRICADLHKALEDDRTRNAPLREIVQPVVLCLFDGGREGKTTVANLLEQLGVPVFSTDWFVRGLIGDWHDSEALRRLAEQYTPSRIYAFIREVESDPLVADEFVRLFFDDTHGFNLRSPLSIIEGYLHTPGRRTKVRLDHAVARALRERGRRVWVAGHFR